MSTPLEHLLLSKEISPTPMRLLVLEYILKQTTAISLQDLEKVFDHSDRTTLYRTLKTFEEKGMIHNIKDGNEATKYAVCEAECRPGEHYDMHIHFYCTNCKELLCLSKEQMPFINLPEKYLMQEVSLFVRGLCAKCSINATELHPVLK